MVDLRNPGPQVTLDGAAILLVSTGAAIIFNGDPVLGALGIGLGLLIILVKYVVR